MRWISNGDPPLYVWEGDEWYNQKTKERYTANIVLFQWEYYDMIGKLTLKFPKKTKVMGQ